MTSPWSVCNTNLSEIVLCRHTNICVSSHTVHTHKHKFTTTRVCGKKVQYMTYSQTYLTYACSVLVRPIINMLSRSRSTSPSLLPFQVVVWTHLLYAQTHSLDVNKSYGSREGKHVHVPSVGLRGHIFYSFPLQTTSMPCRALLVSYLQQHYRKICLIFYA